MFRKGLFLAWVSALFFFGASASMGQMPVNHAAQWMEAHRDNTPMLRQFLQRMPKGADLHSHISGAVYAETYLKLAADAGWCVNPTQLKFVAPPCAADAQPAQGLPASVYGAMVDRLSMRNYAFSGRSGHDQFFATFGDFSPATGLPGSFRTMQAEVRDRAASQNIQYLELMTTVQGGALRALGKQLPWANEPDMSRRRQWLLDNGLMALVVAGRKDMDGAEADYNRSQDCGTPFAKPGCAVEVRWLQQTTRTKAPEEVFAQLAYAFELAKADSRMVGVQLVAPEDDPVALRDYRMQMEMIGFLSRLSPQVKVTLHAGELTLGLVPPENLRFHIRDAVEVAGARRIGHGVGIGYEDDAMHTLETMRKRGVAAEICLTSNDVILGVKGDAHPLPTYLKAGVPVVLASDDEGVSRIDLTNEYLRAVQTYRLDYRTIKQIARNSLIYSFLPEEEKQAALASLDKAFEAFEKMPEWHALN